MTKKQKSAKKSFISSVLVLCLCFTMFVGTTFAWYNDSVTSGRNTIVSGSLEMVLEKYTGAIDGGVFADSWEAVTDQTKIFNETDGALTFEPGAVQVAYVRVKNAGDLAFKYSLAAKVFEEKAGTNQAGDAYMLSDYLKFGTATVTVPYTTREAAVAGVPGAAKLQDAALSTDGAYLKKTDAPVIIALVIYMPSDVGNVANPKPDKKPEISFGLNALATQYTIERDSFSEDYDGAATMPAVATASVEAGEATTVTAGQVTVEVPAGSNNADADDTLRLEVNNFKDDATTGAVTMNIELVNQDGDKVTNTTDPMTVKVNVGTGKAITSVKHNGTEVANYTYDDATGILTFTTSSFSPFAIKYIVGKGVATVAELKAAIADSSIDTIVLTDDIALNEILLLNRSVTIKGDRHRVSSTANRVIRVTTANCDVKFYDTDIVSECTANSDVRGISFDTASAGSSLLLDGCTVSASFYAINAVPGADNLKIDVKNGTVAAGWAAFNLYCNDSVINVEDSTLKGLNDKGENVWNNFNTITFDGNALYNANYGAHGCNNTLNIKNSTVKAYSESENIQNWVGIQYGALNNTVIVDSASRIVDDNGADMTDVFNVGYYCNYNNGSWTYYENGSNKITVGGVELEYAKYPDGFTD